MTHSTSFPPDDAPNPAYGEVPPVQGYSVPPIPAYDDRDTAGSTQSTDSTTDVAKQQAGDVAAGAADAGKHVAGVAQDQAQNVAAEATNQAKDLIHQTRGELTEQAAAQQKRAASALRALGDELGSMARSTDNPGVASDLARQAADRSGSIAAWLDDREPGHVLDEVTSFARRRPGAFLAIAAGAGLLAGRLGRGLTAGGYSGDRTQTPRTGAAPAPQTPSDARRVVPATEQFDQYASDRLGSTTDAPQRPGSSPDYTAQPGYSTPATDVRP